MKTYMLLNGLRWSRNSGSILCNTLKKWCFRTAWGGIYLGAGSKLLIGVNLADNIIVGANAVVTKSFNEPNIVLAGIPARKISEKGMKSGRTKV